MCWTGKTSQKYKFPICRTPFLSPFSLTSMSCTKKIYRPEMESNRKSLPTSGPLLKTAAQDRLLANKSAVEHASNSPAVVSDTLFLELHVMEVFALYFAQLIAKVRPDKRYGILRVQFLFTTRDGFNL